MEPLHHVYRFGAGRTDGHRNLKSLLGGKGANLAEMSQLGLPVPPGFTVTTGACAAYYDAGRQWPEGLTREVEAGVQHLEAATGRRLGDLDRPLLVSVRSGAAVSMPGMMDTILNLGLNDRVAEALARETGDERFAFDAYRRFLDMFGDVVMGIPHHGFEQALAALKEERGVRLDTDLTAADLRELVERYKVVYRRHTGHMPPEAPREQLQLAIEAVFGSWMSDRAVKYRQINGVRGLLGTAVNVQAMVFGNRGEGCGTGVLFSRHPSTGAPGLFGEYLPNAQGEDVVAGIRTPLALTALRDEMPAVYDELVAAVERVERHYGDMQDMEFTVENGTLYLLQTRGGKRTGAAAVRIAADLVREGIVSRERAVRDLVEPRHIEQLLHPRFADEAAYADRVIARGLPASPGAAVGQVVFSAEAAEAARAEGRPRRPRPHRDEPRGRRRDARRRGDPHLAWRHDQPRGGRRQRLGQALHRRQRRHRRQRGAPPVHDGRRHGPRGRLDLAQRGLWRGRPRAGGPRAARGLRRLRRLHGVGRRIPAPPRPR